MRRAVRNLLISILVLIFYFVILIPLTPTFTSFVDSFVDSNRSMFRIPTTVFKHVVENSTVRVIEEYNYIDLTILLKFVIRFIVYVVLPIMIMFSPLRMR
ncbi:MAG: hypothetical protein N3G79_06905 [Sulfolobales archaeon]|nr:hypothetical protein [Sulfolobales archaeon]